MKVLAVFSTVGQGMHGRYWGTSNRVFDLERLDEAAIAFMEGQLQMEGAPEFPGTTIDRALVTNIIRLEAT